MVNGIQLKLCRDNQPPTHQDELRKNDCTIVVYYSREKGQKEIKSRKREKKKKGKTGKKLRKLQ
jgi:hypothetical protein